MVFREKRVTVHRKTRKITQDHAGTRKITQDQINKESIMKHNKMTGPERVLAYFERRKKGLDKLAEGKQVNAKHAKESLSRSKQIAEKAAGTKSGLSNPSIIVPGSDIEVPGREIVVPGHDFEVSDMKLWVNNSKSSFEYYAADPMTDRKTYLSKKNEMELIRALAQREYEELLAEAALNEGRVIEQLLHDYPAITVEKVYDCLQPAKRAVVTPIVQSDEEFVKCWLAEPFRTNPFPIGDTGLETDRGEIVRTRAEFIIANELNKRGIPYRYEAGVYLKGRGMVYPDFTVLNVRERKVYLWEHFGLLTEADYAEENLPKLESYEENGYFPGENLIVTIETKDPVTGNGKINMRIIREMIERYCL